jgi:hypothetical protein
MLGICFFTQRREYTGEPACEGETGLVGKRGDFLVKAKFFPPYKLNFET